MKELLENTPSYQIAGILFIIAIISHIVLSVLLKKISFHANKSQNKLDDYLISAINMPLKVLFWYGWIYVYAFLFEEQVSILTQLVKNINIAPVFIITWGVIRIISNTESYMLESSSTIDKDSIRMFSRVTKILLILVVVLGVAQFLGFSISSVLTLGGVGGIILGFAAQDMLANIFGGLMIQLDKPFSTGDWIRVTDKNLEGIVEKIGWRMTRIRTFNKNPVYVPNSIFTTVPIETPSRMTNRCIKEIIGVRYDDIKKLPAILNDTKKMLEKHKSRDETQPLYVYFDYFNSSSLDFNIHIYTNATDKAEYQKTKEEILLNIANIIDKHKAEIAYPTQTLHIQK